MKKLELKKELLNNLIEQQKKTVETAKKEMVAVQESVVEEKSSIEDSMESFRESLQNERELYARQVQEGMESLAVLNRISVGENNSIKLGSVVKTDKMNYFISISLGKVQVNGDSFIAISTDAPVYQEMAGKKKGETFTFRNDTVKITDVF